MTVLAGVSGTGKSQSCQDCIHILAASLFEPLRAAELGQSGIHAWFFQLHR